jgi:hypothetical protein
MKDGTFVLDAHTGFWDASPENTKNRFGDAFIETFYAFHSGFNPPDPKWTMDYEQTFRKVDPDGTWRRCSSRARPTWRSCPPRC